MPEDEASQTGSATAEPSLAATRTPGMQHAEPDDPVNAQLAQVEERLVTHYAYHGHYNEAEVRDHVERTKQHFVNARIRSFLPILIERAVKATLTSRADSRGQP